MKLSESGFCLVLALGSLLCACDNSGEPSADAQAVEAAEKYKKIEERLSQLEIDVGAIEFAQKFERTIYRSGTFDPADSTFQRIDATLSHGSFTVAIEDVQPFGDGVRVELSLGNPQSAGYANAKLHLKYGPRRPDDVSKWTDWESTLKTKEHTVIERIQPGFWNPIKVTLPGIKADQFGYLEVSIETSTIYLNRR